MNLSYIINCISNIGFPIVVCILLFKQNQEMQVIAQKLIEKIKTPK